MALRDEMLRWQRDMHTCPPRCALDFQGSTESLGALAH